VQFGIYDEKLVIIHRFYVRNWNLHMTDKSFSSDPLPDTPGPSGSPKVEMLDHPY